MFLDKIRSYALKAPFKIHTFDAIFNQTSVKHDYYKKIISLSSLQISKTAPDQIENKFIIRSATHVGRDCCSDYKKIVDKSVRV